MKTIIQEIVKKIINENNQNMETLFVEQKDISKYIIQTRKMLDEIGTELVQNALETADEMIRDSVKRKKDWYVQRKGDKKTLLTIFGEVHYERTYYRSKKDGTYCYISDEGLGIDPHNRMDLSFQSGLVEKALDISYQKSGDSISKGARVTNQTVMNCIRGLGEIKNSYVEINHPKKEVDIIYIEADEDHVAMQDGSNKQVKLVYVHEGRKQVGKDRYELNNQRYFTGTYTNSDELWLEVADYLDKAYEMDKVKKIYLSGDGAKWIKEGLGWIKGSLYVLDYFHLTKYVKRATAHMSYAGPALWDYIHRLDKRSVKDLFKVIIDETESKTKREAIQECRSYILNNWEGIKRRYEEDYIGCSAEGHVSHILSARLSSRPLGWCLTGADQMARLRVHRANGGNIYDMVVQKRNKAIKDRRIFNLDKRIVKKRLKTDINETIDNITVLNIGKRTVANEMLKSIRGA